MSDQTSNPVPPQRGRHQPNASGWYFSLAVCLLLGAGAIRLSGLIQSPPGLHNDELVNAQIASLLRGGYFKIIYLEVMPARNSMYHGLLALSTTISGRGVLFWRLPSVWISLVTLALLTRYTRHLFGVRVSLLTLALCAFLVWPVWLSRSMLAVLPMPLFMLATLYAFTLGYQAQEITLASLWFTVGGVLLGLMGYTHVMAAAVPLIILIFITYRWTMERGELAYHWSNVVYAGGVALVISLPLFMFIFRHPGSRLPLEDGSLSALLSGAPVRLWEGISALAIPGAVFPLEGLPSALLLPPPVTMLAALGIGVAVAGWRQAEYGLILAWIGGGLLFSALIGPLNYETLTLILPPLLISAAVGVYALFRVGRTITRSQPAWVMDAAGAIGVALLVSGVAVGTARTLLIRWPADPQVAAAYNGEMGRLAHYLDTSSDPSPVSICTIPADRSEDPFALSNRSTLIYIMHRQNLPIRYFNCMDSLIVAQGGTAQRVIFPRETAYTGLPGPLLSWMRYAEDLPVPGLPPDTVLRFTPGDAFVDKVGAFITTAPVAYGTESGNSQLATLPVDFDGGVAFLGYTVRDPAIQPTDWVEVTTYWRVDAPPTRNLTQFAHLLSNPVVVIAQTDTLGAQVQTLQPGDVFLQYSLIQTPRGIVPGFYAVSVGLYDPETLERLNALEAGEVRGNRLFLQQIEVLR